MKLSVSHPAVAKAISELDSELLRRQKVKYINNYEFVRLFNKRYHCTVTVNTSGKIATNDIYFLSEKYKTLFILKFGAAK